MLHKQILPVTNSSSLSLVTIAVALCITIIVHAGIDWLIPRSALAHSPTEVTLKYDRDAGVLTVAISHSVSNPEKHYIKSVQISKNGEITESYDYKNQPDGSHFVYSYKINATSGDELKVKAKCSYFGSKTAALIVP